MTAALDPAATVVELSNAVSEIFDGSDPESRIGFTTELITIDADGWGHIAFLSVGEVLVLDNIHLRIGLWPNSGSSANLIRTGQGTPPFVHDATAFALGRHTCRGRNFDEPEQLAVFDGEITNIGRVVASYVVLRSDITFDPPDESAVLDRWKATLDALRSHRSCETEAAR